MGLINLLLKAFILVLDLRDTYDALDAVKLEEIGSNERTVLVRNAEDGTKQATTRRRVGTSKRKAAVKSALTTVLVWNLFQKVEPVCDRSIAWFVPFYDSFKTLFLIWMLFTRSYGASILVYRFLAPMIRPYESIIDGTIGLTLALFNSIASLLAPLVDRCRGPLQSLKSLVFDSSQSQTPMVATESKTATPPSRATTVAKSKKKPPPSLPPPSVKAPPASVSSKVNHDSNGVPGQATLRTRQAPVKKASQNSLAATRRVLQELPVPRHAFDSAPTASIAPLATQATNGAILHPNAVHTGVKAEPARSDLKSSAPADSAPLPSTALTNLGAPPTPPTDLRNYAFIPGVTPQRAGPSSVISPTPRFPGSFSFSVAAPSASTVNGSNPFQPHTRVPATAQMAPLSLATQQSSMQSFGALGLGNGAGGRLSTHESVASADDDRIVPPPNGLPSVRKVSSSRSLKGKAAATAGQKVATTTSSSRKRGRDDRDSETEDGSKTSKVSPKKRAKTSAGRTASIQGTNGASAAKARPKAKATDAITSAAATKAKAAPRKKASASEISSKTPAAPREGSDIAKRSAVATDESTKRKSTSPRKKSTTTSAAPKSTAQRSLTKKASTASIAARGGSADSAEASEAPKRLTRSRTKQNLAG